MKLKIKRHKSIEKMLLHEKKEKEKLLEKLVDKIIRKKIDAKRLFKTIKDYQGKGYAIIKNYLEEYKQVRLI